MRDGDMSADAALKTLEAIGPQRTAEARGTAPLLVGYIPFSNQQERAKAGVNDVDVVGAIDYYLTPRGRSLARPTSCASPALAPSWAGMPSTLPRCC